MLRRSRWRAHQRVASHAAMQRREAARDGRAELARGWLFDEEKLRASLRQLARGLVALHAAGKVHRDIKPSNVLVSHDGRVVILDFGLVRDTVEAAPAETDLIVGTISHMAPEQAAGEELGPPADWYSVGVVLYQCLTGRPPFEGLATDVLERKQREDPPRPRDVASGVPEDLDSLCMELLARDPRVRRCGADVVARLGSSAADRVAAAEQASRRGDASPRTVAVRRAGGGDGRPRGRARARARAGAAVTIVVEGESGVGKSALVRRFTKGLQGASEDGDDAPRALVLAGRCYEREDVPYKAIDGVIDGRFLGPPSPPSAAAPTSRPAHALDRLRPRLRLPGACGAPRPEWRLAPHFVSWGCKRVARSSFTRCASCSRISPRSGRSSS